MVKSDLIGNSREMELVEEMTQRASQVDATVLLLGETGVGKDIIARKIHKESLRREGPFIKVNCAAIPENLLESELFGYEKGAFTGAYNKGKPGMFELADSGTIFLDEVGDLPLNLQAKLLRVLQEKEITRIGGTKPQKLDLRIIAATNKELQKMVKNELFREDLYYRLNVVPIHIPPLRARRDDIALLVGHYLDYYNHKYNRKKQLSSAALGILKQYSWPGNVRELTNLLERLVIITKDDLIDTEHLKSLVDGNILELYAYNGDNKASLEEAVASLEKDLVKKALAVHGSTRKAAKALGVSQPTVVRKLQKYGINPV